MVTRADVISEARAWVGTPFRHQCDVKGSGCDCAGLLRGVAMALGLFQVNYRNLPEAQPFLGYSASPDGVSMRKACGIFLTPLAHRTELQPGHLVLMAFGRDPSHTGIIVDYRDGLGIVHALQRRGRVVEHRLDSRWRSYITAVYSFPSVT